MQGFYNMRFRRQRMPINKTPQVWTQKIKNSLLPFAASISQKSKEFIEQLLSLDNIDNLSDIFKWNYSIKDPIPSPICSKTMNKNQNPISYRCYDCMQSISSCICEQCFREGDHKGHNYIQYEASNGCCDCGNQQAWKKKGFCKKHSQINQIKCSVDQSLKKRFVQELSIAFSIYFSLSHQKQSFLLKALYGGIFFGYLINLVNMPSHQMKMLGFALIQSRLPAKYLPEQLDSQLTILQLMFRQSKNSEGLSNFLRFLFQLFPVEQARIQIIKQYLNKLKRPQDQFDHDHPLAQINFQFLSCVKLLTKMVIQQQVKPVQLFEESQVSQIHTLDDSFKKLYQDLDYINNMKPAKQYCKQHFLRMNVVDMAYYRKFTRYSKQKQMNYTNLDIDQFFLKILGISISKIISQKQVMQKSLRQLYQFLEKENVNCISLAQERAFAMFTMAYFDGDIYQLKNAEVRQAFKAKLSINGVMADNLKHILKTSLRTYNLIIDNSGYDTNQFQRYFLQLNPQKNFNYFLDVIFHKILLLISQDIFEYSAVIQELICEIIKEGNEYINGKMQEWQVIQILKKTQYQLYNVVKLCNTVAFINLDQIVIANFLGIRQEHKVQEFLARLLSSFKQLTIKQFKSLAQQIIKNQQLFQEFVKNKTVIQKGKLRILEEKKHLQSYIYNKIFQKYQRKIFQVETCYLQGDQINSQFKNVKIYTMDSLFQLKKFSMEVIQQLHFNDKQIIEYFSLLQMQIFKIYLFNYDQKLQLYFNSLMNEGLRKQLPHDLIHQITIILKKQDEAQKHRMKQERGISEMMKKKKQKLLEKKKNMLEKFKLNQQKCLLKYQGNSEEMGSQSPQKDAIQSQSEQTPTQLCVACKDNKIKQQLNYFCFINLSNLIQKTVLKNNSYHIFFRTCGHKIHKSCYDNSLNHNSFKFCFLCKSQSNILIPFLSIQKDICQEEKNQKITALFTQILTVLLNQNLYEHSNQIKLNLLTEHFQQIGAPSLLFLSIVRQLIYIGMQDFSRFKKIYLVYKELYYFLKINKNIKNMLDLDKLIKLNNQAEHKLIELQKFIMIELYIDLTHDQCPISKGFSINLTNEEILSAKQLINYFIQHPNSIQMKLPSLKIINEAELFIKIPQKLNELQTYMGKCNTQNCQNTTNQIYMCLICGWSACRKCLPLLYQHGIRDHFDGTVFLGCSNGSTKYFLGDKIFEDDSIYQNYLGQNYLYAQAMTAKTDKFQLNKDKLNKIYALILSYGLHQKIFNND